MASELHVLRTMILWATRVRQANGSWPLRDYPLRGLNLPREEDVRRPIASHDRFLILRTDEASMLGVMNAPSKLRSVG